MKKVRKEVGGVVKVWSLKEKIFGMTFFNPNITGLKCGRDREIETANTVAEYIKNTTRNVLFQNVGWLSMKPGHTSGQI